MTANHLTAEQIAASGPHPSGVLGWGFGVDVQLVQPGPGRSVSSYGWEGGLGSSWANDPVEDVTAVLLTNEAFTSPSGPAVVHDFWTLPYTALS